MHTMYLMYTIYTLTRKYLYGNLSLADVDI